MLSESSAAQHLTSKYNIALESHLTGFMTFSGSFEVIKKIGADMFSAKLFYSNRLGDLGDTFFRQA